MRTKALINCAVTTQLICVFVFAYGRFSHDMALIIKFMKVLEMTLVFCEIGLRKHDEDSSIDPLINSTQKADNKIMSAKFQKAFRSICFVFRRQTLYGSETHLREVPIYVKSRIVTS